jgi:hypothetical protein
MSFAQMEDYIEEDPEPVVKRHRGFAYSLLEYGSGLGFFLELPMTGFYHIGGSFDAFMLRDSKEFTIPSYYGYGYYQFNKRNNVYMFDLMLSLKKRFFAHDLDNSIRPFLAVQAGPVFAMNFPEEYVDETGLVVKEDDQYMWTLSGAAALGVDADVNNNTFMGLRLQYRVIPFPEKLGERKDQSMIDIRLEIGQKF